MKAMRAAIVPMMNVSNEDLKGCLSVNCPLNAPMRRKTTAVRSVEIKNL